MAGWGDLPYELLLQILQELNKHQLSIISLVDQFIHQIVTPFLYRTIHLQNYRLSLLLRTFTRNRQLAKHVRHAELTWNGYMDGILFDENRIDIPSPPLDDFSRKYYPGFLNPRFGLSELWKEHAAGSRKLEHSVDLEWALRKGSESGQVVLALMYMENLETLTVKPPIKSTKFIQLTYDLFATGKFLTQLRSYTRIGTRELLQPPMRCIAFPAMFGQSMLEIQLGPSPFWALDHEYDKLSPIIDWNEKIGESPIQIIEIHGGSLEHGALSSILGFPKSLRSFTYNSSFMARYSTCPNVPFTLQELDSALMVHAASLTTLILSFPFRLAVNTSHEHFGRLASLRQFTALKKLNVPIDALLGTSPGGGIFQRKILPKSLVNLTISQPGFAVCQGQSNWNDSNCLEALLGGIRNAESHCPILKTIHCRCFDDPVIGENFVVSTLSLGIDIKCEL